VAAMQDDLALGIRPELVRSFHATGKTDDRLGHITAQYWLDRLAGDPEMQQRLAAGDPIMRQRFRVACMYVSGRCGDATPEEEVAHRNWLASSPRQGRRSMKRFCFVLTALCLGVLPAHHSRYSAA